VLTPYVQATGADLYLVPAAGGASQRLVEGAAYPAWSPDGREIAFQSNRSGSWDIWCVASQGGQPRPVTADDEIDYMPSWSPDGRWIAFASSSGLRFAPADGSARPRLLLDARVSILSPKWSPDGRWIYFSWYQAGTAPSLWRIAFSPELAAGDAAGSIERISLGESSDASLALGGGGRLLAWSKVEYAPDIWELDVASGDLRQVTDTSCGEDYPHLSPDGRTLLVESSCGGGTGLWTIDLVDGARERLTPPETLARWPRWSPDGGSILYTSEERGSPVQLMTRSRRALDARPLLSISEEYKGNLTAPQWAPDGRRVTVTASLNPAGSEIDLLVVDRESLESAVVYQARGRIAGFPTFDSDGSVIFLHVEDDAEPRQLWAVPSRGGEPRQITHGELELSHPQGTPARPGEILVVVDHKNLALVSESTGDLTYLTRFDDSTVMIDYPSWGPDGRKVHFSLNRRVGDLYLIENPQPAAGNARE